MTLNLEPIKARLEACTAAAEECNWSYNKDDSTLYNVDSFYLETNRVVHGPVIMHEDGEFIANAPTDIFALVDTVEKHQSLINKIKAVCEQSNNSDGAYILRLIEDMEGEQNAKIE